MNHQHIYNSKCGICHQNHQAVPTCATYCSHCDSIHRINDLVDEVCPKKTDFGKKVENRSIPCEFCNSEQVLQETEKQVIRLLTFMQISPEAEKVRESNCARCFGKKFVPRIVECCEQGCSNCGYLTVKINPVAKQYHMMPMPAECEQDCPICHLTIMKESPIFRMQCNHQYHFLCLSEWLKVSTSCPVCRQKDMFIELTPEYFQEVRRLRMESGEKQPITINEDGEIVIGDVQEEQQYYDDQEAEFDFMNHFDDQIHQE